MAAEFTDANFQEKVLSSDKLTLWPQNSPMPISRKRYYPLIN
jgi:hypothetical protein